MQPGAKLAVIGFCFGGGMTWQLLAAGDPRIAAAVPFYGPLPDGADFSGSPSAAVLGIYAEQDSRVDASRDAAEAALEAAGLEHELRTFAGVDHAFFNDTGARDDPAAADRGVRGDAGVVRRAPLLTSTLTAPARPTDGRAVSIQGVRWSIGVMNVRGPVAATAATTAGAFEGFYRRELDGQVRRAALMVRCDELANDIVHDAMVEVYRRWDQLVTPGAYLNRAVLNGCREAARRESVHQRVSPRLLDRAPRPHGDGGLDDVLGALPFHQRAAVVLRFYDGLTTAEIAAALDCAPGSVGPWIDRALKKLRKVLP